MAYKRLDAHDGGNYNWLGSYIDWHCCQINCNQLGLCIDEYIVGGFDGEFDGGFDSRFNIGFDSGFNGRFHLAVMGYQPQQSVRQLRRDAFTAISREGLTGSLLNEHIVLQTL